MLGAMVRWVWKRSKIAVGFTATTLAGEAIIQWFTANQHYIHQFYTYLEGHAPAWWSLIWQSIKLALKLNS